ncbi:hypothetical protein PAEPH01_0994 [Pancytospora epiphaga]|nr:hypothetical protein PAEPH01_0994 [Pancytospora epiphaga]
MDGDECQHTITNGVCINCGLCIDGDDLVTTYTRTAVIPTRILHPRYITREHTPKLSVTAQNIISTLGLSAYESQIKVLIETVKFSTRLCHEDKVAVILYNLCKKDGFPLSLADLLSFTKINKYRFLKAHRDAFGYKEVSIEYLKAIFRREVYNAECHGISSDITFGSFLRLVGLYSACNVSDLCVAAILHGSTTENRLSSMIMVLGKGRESSIRRIFKRINS